MCTRICVFLRLYAPIGMDWYVLVCIVAYWQILVSVDMNILMYYVHIHVNCLNCTIKIYFNIDRL